MLVLSSSGFADARLSPFCLRHMKEAGLPLSAAILVNAAAPLKEKSRWALFTAGALSESGIEAIEFLDLDRDPPGALLDYGLLVILGGNPYLLFKSVKDAGAEGALRAAAESERIVVGISAGAMLFCSGIHYVEEWNSLMGFGGSKGNSIGLKDLSGLNLAPLALFPHYDLFSAMAPSLEAGLAKIEERDGLRLTRVDNDDSWLWKDGRLVLVE